MMQPKNGTRFVTWKEYLASGLSVATGIIGIGALSITTHATTAGHPDTVRRAEYERTADHITKQLERIETKLDNLAAANARQ